jgi:hypothetical protein
VGQPSAYLDRRIHRRAFGWSETGTGQTRHSPVDEAGEPSTFVKDPASQLKGGA